MASLELIKDGGNAARKIKGENPLFPSNLGFRVFRLHASDIQFWDLDRDGSSRSLPDTDGHVKYDRGEQDVLFELLLKIDLHPMPLIKTGKLGGVAAHNIGAGSLSARLASRSARESVEPLPQGGVAQHQGRASASETRIAFQGCAFANNMARSNLAALLKRNGLENARRL